MSQQRWHVTNRRRHVAPISRPGKSKRRASPPWPDATQPAPRPCAGPTSGHSDCRAARPNPQPHHACGNAPAPRRPVRGRRRLHASAPRSAGSTSSAPYFWGGAPPRGVSPRRSLEFCDRGVGCVGRRQGRRHGLRWPIVAATHQHWRNAARV